MSNASGRANGRAGGLVLYASIPQSFDSPCNEADLAADVEPLKDDAALEADADARDAEADLAADVDLKALSETRGSPRRNQRSAKEKWPLERQRQKKKKCQN